MKVRFLRIVSIALASLAISSVATAAIDMDSRVTQLEKQMKQVHTETAIGTYGAETATGRPEVDGSGAFVNLEVLCWHLKNPDSTYTLTDSIQPGVFPIDGRVHANDFGWSWGFRVGLGYNFEHDSWDVGAKYTYFDTSDSTSESGDVLYPLRAAGIAPVINAGGAVSLTETANFFYCTRIQSTYDFNFQNLDVDLGRMFYVSKMLALRPFWGLKTAWLSSTQKTSHRGGKELESVHVPALEIPTGIKIYGLEGNVIHIKDENDFWGLGPRVGCDSRWNFGAGFSLFGNVSAALLYGYQQKEHEERYSLYNDYDDYIDEKYSYHGVSPTVQMQLGLRYDTYVNHDKQHFGVGLGYDSQYWWDQTEIGGPLAMYGVTLDFRFDW